MKKIFTLLFALSLTVGAMAQHGTMYFAGPATMEVPAMSVLQNNESDVISFLMSSTSTGDITVPTLSYNAMGLTIPSFTIHNVKFNYDMATHNVTFPEQTFTETIMVDSAEKVITGSSLSGSFSRATNCLSLIISFSYGRMPFPIKYTIADAKYDATLGIHTISSKVGDMPMYDMNGRQTSGNMRGIYIYGGKKFIKK